VAWVLDIQSEKRQASFMVFLVPREPVGRIPRRGRETGLPATGPVTAESGLLGSACPACPACLVPSVAPCHSLACDLQGRP
jgi:hypothetical protein